jgi:hypothetical protein
MRLSAQQLKLQQLDHSPISPLTFTLRRAGIVPPTATVAAGVYHLQVRNGLTVTDLNFDLSRKNQPVTAGDSIKIQHSRSASAYGYFRLTSGTYVISVREYPNYTATIEVK